MPLVPGNLADVLDDVDTMFRPFDLTRGLGRELANLAAQEINAYMDSELDPDGMPWPRLSPEYAAWKATVAPGAQMAVLYGIMKTPEQLHGEVAITYASMTQRYGTDDQAREEARKFSEGGALTGTNQPERWFYAFNTRCFDEMGKACDRTFAALFP